MGHKVFEVFGFQSLCMLPQHGEIYARFFTDFGEVHAVCSGGDVCDEKRTLAMLGDEIANSLIFFVVIPVSDHHLIFYIFLRFGKQDGSICFLRPELIFQSMHHDT
jgi:hypothetical protein